MKKYIYLVVLLLAFISCNKRKQGNESPPKILNEIFVADSLQNETTEFLLSDVVSDIEIIPLETTEQSAFKFLTNLQVGANDIFINSRIAVLRFDINGKFLHKIGSKGEGPQDFIICNGIGIDDQARLVHIAAALSSTNHIRTFTYDGKFVKSTRVAEDGAYMSGSTHGEDRSYAFFNNQHLFRRMLPVWDGSKDIWLIQIQDTAGNIKARFYDPANYGSEGQIHKHSADGKNIIPHYWNEFSCVFNRYNDKINFLFDTNDTIYQYNDVKATLKPRFILHCGSRPTITEIRKLDKSPEYFKYVVVTDVLETKDWMFLIAEKDNLSYLLRFDKQTGSIQTIHTEGEIAESRIMQIRYRKTDPPGFTNDLCGGLPFYPSFQTEKRWIAQFDAADLLEKVDLNELKNSDYLLPSKRDKLVKIIENLKEDDNPVLMIATLK